MALRIIGSGSALNNTDSVNTPPHCGLADSVKLVSSNVLFKSILDSADRSVLAIELKQHDHWAIAPDEICKVELRSAFSIESGKKLLKEVQEIENTISELNDIKRRSEELLALFENLAEPSGTTAQLADIDAIYEILENTPSCKVVKLFDTSRPDSLFKTVWNSASFRLDELSSCINVDEITSSAIATLNDFINNIKHMIKANENRLLHAVIARENTSAATGSIDSALKAKSQLT